MGVSLVGVTGDRIVYEAGSGSYAFSVGPGFRVSLGFVEDEWRVSSYGSFATG